MTGGESTSQSKINSTLGSIIIIITVAFMVLQGAIWTGVIKADSLGNLGLGLDKVLENPSFVGLLATLIVGTASGFMQNVMKKNDTFDLTKFGETFFYYVPLLILFAQFLPVNYSAVLLFVIDAFRRVLLKLVPSASTTSTPSALKDVITSSPWTATKTLMDSGYGPAGTTIWTRNVLKNGSFDHQEVSTTDPTK